MKIAVCLSGQPRTIEYAMPSILNFFSGEHQYDFFCHAWNYNTYKRLKNNPKIGEQPVTWSDDEPVDVVHLTNILMKLSPKKYMIQGVDVLDIPRFGWDSLFYSMMCANYLKKEYEVENNFRYDFVVKTRYDSIYPPNDKFKLTPPANKNNYLDIYHLVAARMEVEYYRYNASDTLFYGSSLAMDIVCDVYREFKLKSKVKLFDDYYHLGPGTSISEYAEDKNIRSIDIMGEFFETVYRPEMIPADPLMEYDYIAAYHRKFYEVLKND